MLMYIQSFLIIPMEVICCKMFYEIFCANRKIKMIYQILFWVSLCGLIYIPAIYLAGLFVLKEFIIISIVTVMAKIYWKISIRKSFILAFFFQSLVLIADYVTIIVDTSLLSEVTDQTQDTQAFFVLLTKIFLFLFIIITRSILGRSQLEQLEDVTWIKFIFFPFFTICIIVALVSKPELIINEKQKQVFWVFALGLFGMNIMLYYLLQDTGKKERELSEKRIFEREAINKFALYETIAESAKQQREISHEYQNQLICIQSLIHAEKYNELEKYVKQITQVVLTDLDYINTNNVIIDAILNEKYDKTLKEGILMINKFSDLSKLSIEDQDIVLLLSNLLNNAIEACRKCSSAKIIKVKFIMDDENIILSVKNSYDGHIKYLEGKYLSTKKKDKFNHGIGIRNILKIIKKYDGYYSIKHDDDFFSFSIIIPR